MPIICGGTGFYIDAVVNESIFPEVPPNKELRKELSNKSAPELFEILQKLDKDRSKNIDAKNSVRLMRAIEIAKALGKVPSIKESKNKKFDVIKIGLTIPDETLKEMITKRMLLRIKKGNDKRS